MQTRHIISTDGFRLQARIVGTSGIPIIFLHGFPFDSSQWLPQLESLPQPARMIAPDLRGLGRSEGPVDPARYSLAVWADDTRAWLDDRNVTRAVVVGLSMGGYTALEFARRHSDRLGALILMDTHPFADTPETVANRRASQQLVAREGVAAIVDSLLDKVLGHQTRLLRPEVVAEVRAMMLRAPAGGVIGALEAMAGRSDSTSLLSEITVPVLVLAGAEDLLTPPSQARTWAPQLPAAVIETIPDAGHLTALEAPDRVNAVIRNFVEGLEPWW